MQKRKTATRQPGSAVREMNCAGIQHDETSRVEVTVGATPEQQNPQTGRTEVQAVHFCSSRVRRIQRHKAGDGTQVPECEVVLRGGLPVLTRPSIVRFEATATSNGRLSMKNAGNVRIVPVPDELIPESPWAYQGGSEDVAAAYGCHSLDELFETRGEPVLS